MLLFSLTVTLRLRVTLLFTVVLLVVVSLLVVPCWSGDKLQTLQFVPAEGPKLNLPGASFNDGFFTLGEIAAGVPVFIVEGIGQAWACNSATGAAAVMCFGAGRMATVAEALRAKDSAAKLVLVPDRGKENQAAQIAADINGEWCELPSENPDNYDANDYGQEFGGDALADLLRRTNAPSMRFKVQSGADLCAAPPMRWWDSPASARWAAATCAWTWVATRASWPSAVPPSAKARPTCAAMAWCWWITLSSVAAGMVLQPKACAG